MLRCELNIIFVFIEVAFRENSGFSYESQKKPFQIHSLLNLWPTVRVFGS